MLQYGSPSQQQAALTSMSAGERFSQGLASEESRYRRKQDNRNRIGQFNPRDYTEESFARFQETGNAADLVRYERIRTFKDADGMTHRYDAATGQEFGAFQEVGDVASNKREINRSAAQGSAEGSAITAAQRGLGDLKTQGAILKKMMDSPEFPGAVGNVDRFTGAVGAWFGSDEGALGNQVKRQVTTLVAQAAVSWKGAMSDREMELFMAGVPGAGSHHDEWRKWYDEEFLPKQRLMERVASGEIFHDDRLQGGSSQTANFDNSLDQSTSNALAQYGVQR
jgi:hypothetical protein